MTERVEIAVASGATTRSVPGLRVVFSPYRLFADFGRARSRAALAQLARTLSSIPGLAMCGEPEFAQALFDADASLRQSVVGWIDTGIGPAATPAGMRQLSLDGPLEGVQCVFVAHREELARQRCERALPDEVEILGPGMLVDIAPGSIPAHAWVPIAKNIYPIDIPEIEIRSGLDMLLMDCPARNLALMPNGLAYVHNALRRTKLDFQTFDLDIVSYHRYHVHRLYDLGGRVILPSGREMPTDPWQAEHYDLWAMPEVIEHFMPIIDEAAARIVAAKPKVLGLSVQQCSEAFSRALIERVRRGHPDVVVVVGGFSCYNPEIGLRGFPEADYMCIGESDLTVGPLAEALARGERPRNMAGILSRYDTPDYRYLPAPMPHNLSQLEPPRYDWFSLDLYKNYNDYQLVPIIASRGCRWSRCTFCAERFYWRIREAKEFVDELEYLVERGCNLYMFNESDLNGMPEKLLDICAEIVRREIKVKLTGQLRIHKKSDKAFFQALAKAGFVALRFGVDAFSDSTMRLQKKGYTSEMVTQNLKDCWESGIYTEVNWVIGVPGETEQDVDEGIELILRNQPYIGRLANINPLILVNGSVYWIDPESHGIRFRVPKEELYANHPRVIPADLWYSVEPFIDAQVRKDRFERIVRTLYERGFPVGAWASRVIDDVKTSRDRNRAGGTRVNADAAE